MTNPTIPADILKTVRETYELELALSENGLNAEAAYKAIEAGIKLYEDRILASIAEEAEQHAEDQAERGDDDFAAALFWFADQVRNRTPVHKREPYIPQDEDYIEVVLSGPVAVHEEICQHCESTTGARIWTVYDHRLEKEFYFEAGDEKHLNIRVLHRDSPES